MCTTRGLVAAALMTLAFLAAAAAANAQATLHGVVVDELGGAIAGARIVVRTSAGVTAQTTTADAGGAFSIAGLPPGTYVVEAHTPLFAPARAEVDVSVEGGASLLRLTMPVAGVVERMVVTGRRIETRLSETPQKIEVIDARDIERTVAADVTDLLKKTSGVDVIQYSGALSGIGIRGFRPQFSGINKRSLLLINGRPSGVTNLATLLLDNVERIEVLKGAASSVYGSSAMGGVVNVITRQSRGPISGYGRVGAGSFGTSEFAAQAGGSISSRVDFDASGSAFDQRSDYRMGDGQVRPATRYSTYNGMVRVGADLTDAWRIDGSANAYRGRDIMTPGDLSTGVNAQGRKNLERSTGDARLRGRLGAHDLSFTGYVASEAGHFVNVTTTDPLDQPFLPYLSFENELAWAGLQANDSWNWSPRNSVVYGLDVERVTSTSRSYTRTGERRAPFSADSNKRTIGVYVENTLRLHDGRTAVALGGRLDRIVTATVDTPFKTNFTPSRSTFTVFNPSLGITHAVLKDLRLHFAVGRAFIPAEASMLTGTTTTVVRGRTQIVQGNPDLKPERSTSVDIGAEWKSAVMRLDATVFRTAVKDRFITNVVVSNPPPPSPIVLSVANGLDARISGVDLEAERRVGRHIGVFANSTHYFNRKERLTSGARQDILNVALNTVRAGVDIDFRRLSARVSGRYVQGRKDNNFNVPGFPIVDYDDFTVIDAMVTYRLARQHAVVLAVNNMLDTFYYEKLGFPLQGVSFKLSYRRGF
jgi:vitamin B12 transporter